MATPRKLTLANRDRSQPECWEVLPFNVYRRYSHGILREKIMSLVNIDWRRKHPADPDTQATRDTNLKNLRAELDRRVAKGLIKLQH